ncbi:Rtr1/RPAP2 family-domain-containing protein [Dendryphion nanum]|uniref:RNA polymerase II subunit B1 CTD phosphatase RPAP2 homolog n=1 Tax=Dendryphion nanum TaxID=256645 RepID=A0A9P9IJ16_9PLEO|nr:Rtr1/RPAP2 family-domain-containing protein [Dendryphion nanum]
MTDLEVARQHANILEERKKIEREVLDSIITLMEFPTAPNADPKRPAASDAAQFRQFMVPFQPSDYDSLIEERNIADLCGYALCPRPKRKARSGAKKYFVDTDKGVEIVDTKLLEVWCSDDCAKRALYVKVQLKEEPAWMRQGGYGDNIELLVENADEHHKALPLRLKKETAAPLPQEAADEEAEIEAAWAARDGALDDLALERGEKPGQLPKANRDLLTSDIKERVASSAPPVAPSQDDQASDAHLAIEGYVPRDQRKRNDADDDSEDDAQDWDKFLPG